MFNPRTLIAIGVAMIAAAVLAATGVHGFWWLFGLAWAFGLFGGGGHRRACGPRYRRRYDSFEPRREPQSSQTGPSQPDPSRDTHTAFPAR